MIGSYTLSISAAPINFQMIVNVSEGGKNRWRIESSSREHPKTYALLNLADVIDSGSIDIKLSKKPQASERQQLTNLTQLICRTMWKTFDDRA